MKKEELDQTNSRCKELEVEIEELSEKMEGLRQEGNAEEIDERDEKINGLEEEDMNKITGILREQEEMIEKWEEKLEILKENERDEMMERTAWIDCSKNGGRTRTSPAPPLCP